MQTAGSASNGQINNPLWLLAELTYRCPLQCLYCSNPIDYAKYQNELTTEDWIRVLQEGRAMGATQLGFSGGEPLVRKDLVDLAREARRLGYYSNLITSGIGMDEARIATLKEAGLDHIQLSFQANTPELNDYIGGAKTFERKLAMARLIKHYDYPMVMNVVLHRQNIDQTEQNPADGRGAGSRFTSSWPTPSITAGPRSTALTCCRRASRWCAPRPSPTTTRNASRGA